MKIDETKSANNYETLDEYLIKKCDSFHNKKFTPFADNKYTLWGKKYEEIATRLYSIFTNQEVHEFGLITHPKYNWLAASPDGISVMKARMLEIKCPLTRKINKDVVPFGYWLQMQMQLECANLKVCDFLECEIKEITREEFLVADPNEIEIGVTGALFENKELRENQLDFVYPPHTRMNLEQFEEWITQNDTPERKSITYFRIYNWHIIEVPREREWFKRIQPDLKEVFMRIRKYQSSKKEYDLYLQSLQALIDEKQQVHDDKHECTLIDDTSEKEDIKLPLVEEEKSQETSEISCHIE